MVELCVYYKSSQPDFQALYETPLELCMELYYDSA